MAKFGSERLVRYGELQPCRTAFIDARTPGSDRKENFTIIGPGVAENPGQHVHIAEPHGFNIGGARQPPHCVNSQHFHETAEAFFAHTKRWEVTLGEHGDEARATLEVGDLISVPIHVFRGFENVGDEPGFLYFMLGGDDPGRVTWAPDVLQRAADHGLILLESGRLIDTAAGETAPKGARRMTPEASNRLLHLVRRLDDAALRGVIAKPEEARPFRPLYAGDGVTEASLIGAANPSEAAPAGKLDWSHGFVTRRLDLEPEARSRRHRRMEPEVIFVHTGDLTVESEGERIVLHPGDTLSLPVGADRQFLAQEGAASALVTRAGDRPLPAVLLD